MLVTRAGHSGDGQRPPGLLPPQQGELVLPCQEHADYRVMKSDETSFIYFYLSFLTGILSFDQR